MNPLTTFPNFQRLSNSLGECGKYFPQFLLVTLASSKFTSWKPKEKSFWSFLSPDYNILAESARMDLYTICLDIHFIVSGLKAVLDMIILEDEFDDYIYDTTIKSRIDSIFSEMCKKKFPTKEKIQKIFEKVKMLKNTKDDELKYVTRLIYNFCELSLTGNITTHISYNFVEEDMCTKESAERTQINIIKKCNEIDYHIGNRPPMKYIITATHSLLEQMAQSIQKDFQRNVDSSYERFEKV